MPLHRSDLIDSFLHNAGWGDAARQALGGDASRRHYTRLSRGASQAMLMDAPPNAGEDIRPFMAVADLLERAGLRPPARLAWDAENGFLLLEDLGDALFARVLEQTPDQEHVLYTAALDALVVLHQHPIPADWPDYRPQMAGLAALAAEWYAPGDQAQLTTLMQKALMPLATDPPVLILRDYHAENLIWRPDAPGAQRVGQLDFQDAMLGHPLYDVVSLLQDARRDVNQMTAKQGLAHFIKTAPTPIADPELAYAVLGAQRNLRILGVFARLCIRDGKPGYLPMIPRVWAHLQSCLAHPHLSDLSDWVAQNLPAPDATHLAALEAKCPKSRP
jgi:aminoglycoside/choline kinase family phosphotransferase